MGTVYKIKKEVKDFIIDTRKKNPSFSCRVLAEQVFNKFNVTISKSYVNTILKKAKLNGPLGRKALSRSSHSRGMRRFVIPKEKKEQIFRTIQQLDVNIELKNDNKEEIKSVIKTLNREKGINRRLSKNENEKGSAIPEDIFVYIKRIRTKKINLRAGIFPKMGRVFFNATEWDMVDYSVLGRIYFQYIKENSGDGLFNMFFYDIDTNMSEGYLFFESLCGVLLGYIDIFNNKIFTKFSDKGLYILNRLRKEIDIVLFIDWLKKQIIKDNFIMRYLRERHFLFKDVAGIQINLFSGEDIFFDNTKEIGFMYSPRIERSMSIRRALDLVSKQIIANTEPFICCYSKLCNNKNNYNQFFHIISALEDMSVRGIKSVMLCDVDGQILTNFNIIPKIKRKFILVILCENKECHPFLCHGNKDKNFVYLESMDKLISFYEDIKELSILNEKRCIRLRRIFIDEYNNSKERMVILTNDMEERIDNIVKDEVFFMAKYNNGEEINFVEERQNICCNNTNKVNNFVGGASLEELSLWDMFIDYVNVLIGYIKCYFMGNQVNNDNVLKDWLDFPGFVYEKNRFLLVSLIPPKDYNYIDYLNFAIDEVNRRNICDFWGRRLYIGIEEGAYS